MIQNKAAESTTPAGSAGRVELVLYLTDEKYLNRDRIAGWAEEFGRVTVTSASAPPANLPGGIRWVRHERNEGRARVWNRLAADAENDWVLFLEDDEMVSPEQVDRLNGSLSPGCWIPSLIRLNGSAGTVHHYIQIRMVPKADPESPVFDGRELPDATRTIIERSCSLSTRFILIERSGIPFSQPDEDQEFAEPVETPQFILAAGERLFRKKKYAQAAAQYRRLLKIEKLLPFDRLAAVNGLAACLAEQYRWTQAMALTRQSLDAEPGQRMPYLIQYRIRQLNKQWPAAYESLKCYHSMLARETRANCDKAIDEKETLVNLAGMAVKTGHEAEALSWYECLAELQPGEKNPELLRKLLQLSIDTGNFEKSARYYRERFEPLLPEMLDEGQIGELHEVMTGFMSRGWYEYTSKVYEKLYLSDPECGEYRRRLIVALSKTNRLDRARTLIAGVA